MSKSNLRIPLLAFLLLTACGVGGDDVDPAAVDAHINGILSREAAAKARDVAASRAREEERIETGEERLRDFERKN